MLKKKTMVIGAAGVLAASLLAGSISAAMAVEPNGSKGPFYLINGDTGVQLPSSAVNTWTSEVFGAINPADIDQVFPGSADVTGVTIFVAPRGSEQTPAQWKATGTGGYTGANKDVIQPTVSLYALDAGDFAGVKAGGNYSLGFAFTKNNGLTIADAGVYYTYISVASGGAGNWTFETPSVVAPPAAPSGTGEIDLSVTTLAAVDGNLSLEVPANASTTLGAPSLVNQLSTSTGQLTNFTVRDARVVSHPGWTLTTSVEDFVKSNEISTEILIGKEQLGLAPKVVSTTAAGVTPGTSQTAGSAVYDSLFAEADDNAQVGDTVFGADLTFVAPVGKPAGTYTSVLTLTLVTKG